MAKVSGMKEKLHMPLYDCFCVPGNRNGSPAKKFSEVMTDPRVLRFFIDVQNKTPLETNLQATSVLPSLNSFEARAMRIVVSPTRVVLDKDKIKTIVKEFGNASIERNVVIDSDVDKLVNQIYAESDNAYVAAGSMLSELIYNSVIELIVGEKCMIKMPTFWFPSGAGVMTGNGFISNHGAPDPMATFRFAEPVFIESQQNFRVEMSFPQGVPDSVSNATGPLRMWAVLDGYLTRDVQ